MDPLASNYFPTATIDDGNCLYDVHFQVDMSTFQGSFSGVYVNGTFNGWCGTCNQLLDDNGNGIYEGYIPYRQIQLNFYILQMVGVGMLSHLAGQNHVFFQPLTLD